MAESLRVIPEPMALDLPPVRFAPAALVESAWHAAHQPQRARGDPPSWLRPAQHEAWRRTVAAIDGWHAALLAEAVGTGKSWIALACAQRFTTTPTIIGPAALAAQWRHTVERAGMQHRWLSHERLSRGEPPDHRAEFVIIDEAHRFRHLETRRSRTLAPWLPGSRVLMLTATPIINRRSDLLALLRMLVPDDALILDGLASIGHLAELRDPPAGLRRLVIRTRATGETTPVHHHALRIDAADRQRAQDAVAAVQALTLGETAGVRNLIATVLLDAAASSDAAWRTALQRYRMLLLQSRDAGGMSRRALRQFAGVELEQLVFWPLLAVADAHGAPPLLDLEHIESLLSLPASPERWMHRLSRLLADQRPTICFTRHRATASALVRHLGDTTAWVTGSSAGIGPHRFARDLVLSAFGPHREQWQFLRRRPCVLVSTEVVAEGLDLQGASRVIHLDLPWHHARLEQRNGRVQRIGQLSPDVVVVSRRPPAAIERVLRMQIGVRRKATMSQRWLEALTVSSAPIGATDPATWCAVASTKASKASAEGKALVKLADGCRTGTIHLELRQGMWHHTDDVSWPSHRWIPPERITELERARMVRLARRAIWQATALGRREGVSRPRLVARLLTLARTARSQRNAAALDRLDRVLALASKAMPLGLDQLLNTLSTASDQELMHADLPSAGDTGRPLPVELVLILYRREETPLR